MYEELMNAKILVDANTLIAAFVHSGLLDKAKCGEILELIKRCSEIQREWIPTKWHKVTDEEREREGYSKEITFMLDGSMPSDEQEILICLKNGYVEKDTCYYEEDGYYTDNGYDWIEDIVAWMPLPEPYEEDIVGNSAYEYLTMPNPYKKSEDKE